MANIQFPNQFDRLIYRGFAKIVYNDNANDGALDIGAGSLGDNGISLSVDGKFVERLPVTIGTVASVNFSVPVSIKVELVKTSLAAQAYYDRVFNGICVANQGLKFTDDANRTWDIEQVSISMDGTEANGKNANYSITIDGVMPLSQALLIYKGLPEITVF